MEAQCQLASENLPQPPFLRWGKLFNSEVTFEVAHCLKGKLTYLHSVLPKGTRKTSVTDTEVAEGASCRAILDLQGSGMGNGDGRTQTRRGL